MRREIKRLARPDLQELSVALSTLKSLRKEQTLSSLSCVICRDIGFVDVGDGLSRRSKPCVCRTEKSIRATLPVRFHNARLADFPTLVDPVASWLRSPTEGMFIGGESEPARHTWRPRWYERNGSQGRRLDSFGQPIFTQRFAPPIEAVARTPRPRRASSETMRHILCLCLMTFVLETLPITSGE